jgi:hypothetical protein
MVRARDGPEDVLWRGSTQPVPAEIGVERGVWPRQLELLQAIRLDVAERLEG